MLRIIRVTGESLAPEFHGGDFVLVIKIPLPFSKYKIGDTVVFDHPFYGFLIKKIERIAKGGEELHVIGNHPLSTDSRQFGPIHCREIVGKVIWHIRKPRTNIVKM